VLATSEDSLLHPISFYGITKQTQESIIMTLCPTIGIAATALRYQNVYGPGQSLSNPYTGILSIFSTRLRGGKDLNVFEDGRESRDFVFIDDVAEATVKAIFSDRASGAIVNVGSGVPISLLEVAQNLRALFSSTVEIAISGQYRIGDIRHNYADLQKAAEVLGWQPKISFDQGLGFFVEWVKQQSTNIDLYDQAIGEMRAKGLHKAARLA
jgi:dTDP-L-rhamnose 4-epimerase